MQRAGQRLAALGITAACDADLRRDTFAAFAEADQAGALHQRIYGLVVHDQVDWLLANGLQGRHSGRLATEAVKIWADGGMSSRTAAIHGSYPVPPHGSGILFFSRDELTAMVREFDARGFQVAVHAQGDRAIGTVLDAYAAVLGGGLGLAGPGLGGPAGSAPAGRNPRRHRIEHAGAMYPALTARAAELGIVIVSQPGFLSALGDGFAAAFPGQADQLYAFGSWRRAGLTVAGSSDAPVISAAPLLGIRDAVTRRTDGGQVLGPGERLTAWRTRSARSSPASSPTSSSWTPTRCRPIPPSSLASRCWPLSWTGPPRTRPRTSFPLAEGLGPWGVRGNEGVHVARHPSPGSGEPEDLDHGRAALK
jgi:predicted amidohydrolase YtcJ